MNEEYQTRQFFNNNMKKLDLQKIIREEIKKTLREAYEFTLAGDTIKGTGDKWPDVNIKSADDGFITLSQKINGRTSKVMLSKKQFEELIKEA